MSWIRPGLVVVDVDRRRDVHRVDQAEALLDARAADEVLDAAGDVDVVAPVRRLEPELFAGAFHLGRRSIAGMRGSIARATSESRSWPIRAWPLDRGRLHRKGDATIVRRDPQSVPSRDRPGKTARGPEGAGDGAQPNWWPPPTRTDSRELLESGALRFAPSLRPTGRRVSACWRRQRVQSNRSRNGAPALPPKTEPPSRGARVASLRPRQSRPSRSSPLPEPRSSARTSAVRCADSSGLGESCSTTGDMDGLEELIELAERLSVSKPRHASRASATDRRRPAELPLPRPREGDQDG